ncbi:MAG: DUF2520 domain-containing protein [Acidobacteriia bacterium]|nr:DUF2520 domain-containing protein [Terriglobia bacterium]
MRKPTIAIVGPGNLGSAMARALHAAGYRVEEIVHRGGASGRRARTLARAVGTRAVELEDAKFSADMVWICVSDGAIGACAGELAKTGKWAGKIALHCSGALSSWELKSLKQRGAAVGSIHPMMTFVRNVRPELRGVTFAIEGDPRAVRAARRVAQDLGGRVVVIAARRKPMYHAFGAFTSPLIVATVAAAERVARKAGLSEASARAAIGPILQQTVRNYLERGKAGAFSGPLVRGDVETVRRHLAVLRAVPEARDAYAALARSALRTLPVKKKKELRELLKPARR